MCATNWLKTFIPNYSKIVKILHDLLEETYKKAGKRRKKVEGKICILLRVVEYYFVWEYEVVAQQGVVLAES